MCECHCHRRHRAARLLACAHYSGLSHRKQGQEKRVISLRTEDAAASFFSAAGGYPAKFIMRACAWVFVCVCACACVHMCFLCQALGNVLPANAI